MLSANIYLYGAHPMAVLSLGTIIQKRSLHAVSLISMMYCGPYEWKLPGRMFFCLSPGREFIHNMYDGESEYLVYPNWSQVYGTYPAIRE